MEAASPSAVTGLPELLSWDEICRRYPDEWVVLIDEIECDFQTEAGRVIGHSPNKQDTREWIRAGLALRGCAGRYWTGNRRYWKFRSHVQRAV